MGKPISQTGKRRLSSLSWASWRCVCTTCPRSQGEQQWGPGQKEDPEDSFHGGWWPRLPRYRVQIGGN